MRFLWVILLGVLVAPTIIFADPIKMGAPHTEFVAYCPTLDAARSFAVVEERSIAAGETTTQYNKKVAPLFDDAGGPCKTGLLTYTVKEVLYKWTGWGRYDKDNAERKEWALVRATTTEGEKELYILTYHLAQQTKK